MIEDNKNIEQTEKVIDGNLVIFNKIKQDSKEYIIGSISVPNKDTQDIYKFKLKRKEKDSEKEIRTLKLNKITTDKDNRILKEIIIHIAPEETVKEEIDSMQLLGISMFLLDEIEDNKNILKDLDNITISEIEPVDTETANRSTIYKENGKITKTVRTIPMIQEIEEDLNKVKVYKK